MNPANCDFCLLQKPPTYQGMRGLFLLDSLLLESTFQPDIFPGLASDSVVASRTYPNSWNSAEQCKLLLFPLEVWFKLYLNICKAVVCRTCSDLHLAVPFQFFLKKVFSKMIAIKFTALGHFTGPIHLTATERPKLTDLGGPTKPNQSSWWNLPRITLRTCHWLCPNSPYMWLTPMRRTRVWSSLTSVPRSISLSRHWPPCSKVNCFLQYQS